MKPRRFALLGDPVGHSKSPAMHAAAYRALGLPHTYEAIRATPGDFPRLLGELRAGVFDGFNVTVPHKRLVMDHVDSVETSARIVGAANTIVSHEDGTLVAYNTDTFALAHEIQNLAPELRGRWAGATALVLGTGGAARSAIVALGVELGAGRIVVRGRSLGDAAKRAAFEEEMGTLVTEAGGAATIVGEPWHARGPHDAEVSVVVQSTSAGMKGADPGEAVNAAVDWSALSPRAVALDVVYAPPETPFLKSAHEHGLRATNGIGMLARQGALAFELWLGVPAPYNAMLTALV